MLFPVIRVRDKGDKDEGRIVGTSSHDELTLDEKGNMQYLNLQCMDGTGKDGSCEFVTKNSYEGPEIEFVTFDELIKIYEKETKGLCEAEHQIIDTAKKLRDKYIKENGLDKNEGISNSSGNII